MSYTEDEYILTLEKTFLTLKHLISLYIKQLKKQLFPQGSV